MNDDEFCEIRISVNNRDWYTNFTGCCMVIILSWLLIGIVFALPVWLVLR